MANLNNFIILNIGKKCNICNNFDKFGLYYNCPNVNWKCYNCAVVNELNIDSDNNLCTFCNKIIGTGTSFLLENNLPIHLSCKKRYYRGVITMEKNHQQNNIIKE